MEIQIETNERRWRRGYSRLQLLYLYLVPLRISHWYRNIVVLAGFYFSATMNYQLLDVILVGKLILGGLLACLISSANYIINEIADSAFDVSHPTKAQRPIAKGIINVEAMAIMAGALYVCSLALGMLFLGVLCFGALSLLMIAGLIYNLEPFRTKDIPYVDVLSESVNNPIRFLIGWFVVSANSHPDILLLGLTWMAGALLMARKRLIEINAYGEYLAAYRPTFAFYSRERLLTSMRVYAVCSILSFIGFSLLYNRLLLWVIPILIVIISQYFKNADMKAQMDPQEEVIYRKGWLVGLYVIAIVLTGIIMGFGR